MSELGVGTAVAGYRIEGVVGQGSSGTVYSALELSLQRRVAVKILRPELARDDRFRERFLRESRVAASLEHPNIIPIYAAGEANGAIYLAMRFVEGRDLARLIADEGALDPERAVELLTQVADALDRGEPWAVSIVERAGGIGIRVGRRVAPSATEGGSSSPEATPAPAERPVVVDISSLPRPLRPGSRSGRCGGGGAP